MYNNNNNNNHYFLQKTQTKEIVRFFLLAKKRKKRYHKNHQQTGENKSRELLTLDKCRCRRKNVEVFLFFLHFQTDTRDTFNFEKKFVFFFSLPHLFFASSKLTGQAADDAAADAASACACVKITCAKAGDSISPEKKREGCAQKTARCCLCGHLNAQIYIGAVFKNLNIRTLHKLESGWLFFITQISNFNFSKRCL